MSKFYPLFPPHFKSNLHNYCHYSATFVSTFGPSLPSIDPISLHFKLLSTLIVLRLQHYSHSPSNITPHSTPNLSAPFYFNYAPLSHHISSIRLYSTHTNTHNNTIVILIAPRHFHFSYCSSLSPFSHTTYYPLCSHLTLNLTACNNTI